jgi:hypothetical protein
VRRFSPGEAKNRLPSGRQKKKNTTLPKAETLTAYVMSTSSPQSIAIEKLVTLAVTFS